MLGWLDYFIVFFWLCLGLFFFNINNFVTILLFAELSWLVLFVISTIVGSTINDLTSTSLTFFILGFGGLEFVIGLMLVVLMKNTNTPLINKDDFLQTNDFKKTNKEGKKKWNL